MERTGILGLIGNTPLLELRSFDVGKCRLFVKLENQNPGGSIKDRIGLFMIEAAERDGKLEPGGTIVEATAGNTGLGLALVAAQKGYRLILVIPDKMSQEKIAHLRALGAEVVLTRSDVNRGHPDYYQDMAERIAREKGGHYINQFGNPANPLAHKTTTGPEIWRQTQGAVDAVVCGVGSGGTVTGLSQYFAAIKPEVEMVVSDPAGSVIAEYVASRTLPRPGSWLVEGIGEDFIPPLCDLSRVRTAYTISDAESFAVARNLLRGDGILAGSSSGTLVAGAVRYCQAQASAKTVVTFICDTGNKYLSKMFSDTWLKEQGLKEGARHGDLRDLISRPFSEGEVITVGPADTLNVAYTRMKLYSISQLPVMDEGRVVGVIDETDLLTALAEGPRAIQAPVRSYMSSALQTISPAGSIEELSGILKQGLVGIVADEGAFYGLITRIDLINHLRRGEGSPVIQSSP